MSTSHERQPRHEPISTVTIDTASQLNPSQCTVCDALCMAAAHDSSLHFWGVPCGFRPRIGCLSRTLRLECGRPSNCTPLPAICCCCGCCFCCCCCRGGCFCCCAAGLSAAMRLGAEDDTAPSLVLGRCGSLHCGAAGLGWLPPPVAATAKVGYPASRGYTRPS